MAIERIRTRLLSLPLDKQSASPHWAPGFKAPVRSRGYILTDIYTGDGVKGTGWSFSGDGWLLKAVQSAIHELGELIIGWDPLQRDVIVRRMQSYCNFFGPGGLVAFAMAAIDIALWDIAGKMEGLALHELLGANTDRVPVYASGCLYREASLEQLVTEAVEYVDRGFKAMKMRLGSETSPCREIERVRVVREAIGDGVDLLVDVNQLWTAERAIGIGRQLERLDVFWLEDPVSAQNLKASAKVAAALDLPIAAGEYLHTPAEFRNLIDATGADIIMIDVLRVGGIGEWLKIAQMAGVWDLPVVTHLVPEIQCHLLASIPNGLMLEYMPWAFPLFVEPPLVEGGDLVLPRKPGLGLEIDERAVSKYKVAESG